MSNKKLVIFDRDGTVNKRLRGGYLLKNSEIQRPKDFMDLSLLLQQGFQLSVASNQACISKGLIDVLEVKALTKEVFGPILALDYSQIFICSHQESDNCECRKPKPQLLFNSINFNKADPNNTFFVGDTQTDRQAAESAGIKFVGVCWDSDCLNSNCAHSLSSAVRMIVDYKTAKEEA